MTYIYLTLSIYYFIGIAFSYEEYKKYDRLDCLNYFTTGLYITLIYSPLWIVRVARRLIKRWSGYYQIQKNHITNTIPKYKEISR